MCVDCWIILFVLLGCFFLFCFFVFLCVVVFVVLFVYVEGLFIVMSDDLMVGVCVWFVNVFDCGDCKGVNCLL